MSWRVGRLRTDWKRRAIGARRHVANLENGSREVEAEENWHGEATFGNDLDDRTADQVVADRLEAKRRAGR